MDELLMSRKERSRMEILSRVKRRELTVVAAAELMGLSVRQARRVWKRYCQEGDGGLVHRLRGRPGNRRLEQEVRDLIVKRHQERYADFGPTLACEKLKEEGFEVSPDTLTGLLKERGLWQRRRKRGRHRHRRERRAYFGSMVQMDGSHHDWFEGRGPRCVLMVLIDDATSRTYARFYDGETLEAAFDAFKRWAMLYGVPMSVYVDRHSLYRDEEHPERPTQFGRAMKDLGVELILAGSPQAKGRVERRNAVFQDRLVKEMWLRGISDMATANAFLEEWFLEDLNRRYAVEAAKAGDMHRAVEGAAVLEGVLCVQEKRVVGRDWCVRWRNRWLQIEAEHGPLDLAGRCVRVKEVAGVGVVVEHQGRRLKVRELAARPEPLRRRKVIVNNRAWKPAADHPWKQARIGRATPRVSLAPAAPALDLHAAQKKGTG